MGWFATNPIAGYLVVGSSISISRVAGIGTGIVFASD